MNSNDIDSFGGVSNRLQPRVFEDLRGWIDALKEEDTLQEIDVEVDWNCELGTIARKAFWHRGRSCNTLQKHNWLQ